MSQVIGYGDCLQHDPYCVEWDVKSTEVLIESLETQPEACSVQTSVAIVMGEENGGHLKDRLLLGRAICYASLFAFHITAMSLLLLYVNKFHLQT